MIKKIRINENEPKRRRFVKENVITDITNMGFINDIDKVKEILRRGYYDINWQDTVLKPIDKPATYMRAKRSANPIIGVKSNAYSSRWDREKGSYVSKEGPSIQGIYGKDFFDAIGGDDSIRSNFADCDTFYEIVPVNPETYKSRSKFYRDRQGDDKTYPIRLGDRVGDLQYGWLTSGINRQFTMDDIMAYDPDYNRKRYAKILSLNHLDKYRNQYEDICDSIDRLKDEFGAISLRDVMNSGENSGARYNYKNFLNEFGKIIDKFDDIKRYIGYVAKEDESTWTEKGLKGYFSQFYVTFNKAQDYLQKLQNSITPTVEDEFIIDEK